MGEPVAFELDRDVVRVGGPEALSYLQGQLSQDVAALPTGGAAQSLLLEPTGKLGLVLRVTRHGDDDLVLDTAAGWGERLVARLQRFKLRTKADIEAVAGWRCLAVRGEHADASAEGISSGWPTWPGVDLLGPEPRLPEGIRRADPGEWERARIEAGVPELGRELEEGMIPAEGGRLLIEATVSFTKGCYTGQELVARVDSRGGNAPRRVLGVLVDGGVLPPVGATVAGSGRLTSVAEAGDGAVGLALVPRAVAEDTAVEVTWDGGRADARVVALPIGR